MLARTIRDGETDPSAATWRARVRGMPPLITEGLRPAQTTAIEGTERSLAQQRHSRSLVQMATGAGKIYTAVTTCYRLLKHGGFRAHPLPGGPEQPGHPDAIRAADQRGRALRRALMAAAFSGA